MSVLRSTSDSERLHQRAFRIELSDKRRHHVERHGEILHQRAEEMLAAGISSPSMIDRSVASGSADFGLG